MSPFFSIIVPVWNREESIKRCLSSVAQQDYLDYEVVVVDDGSDDASLAVLKEYTDPRMRVLCHTNNQGVCAARHTATSHSCGAWVLSLDSDWTLVPSALSTLAALAARASQDVGVIGAYAKSDQGELWPGNPLPDRVFGFVEFLNWMDTAQPSDFLSCRRREVFDEITWPTDRRLELQFNLRVARAWKTLVCRDVLATAFTDCSNRYMTDQSPCGVARKLARAADEAKSHEEILEEFGADLKRHVPRAYFNLLLGTSHKHFCAGNRLRGLKYAQIGLTQKPWIVRAYAKTLIGLMGPKAMALLGSSQFAQRFYHFVTRFA